MQGDQVHLATAAQEGIAHDQPKKD
jgi:hypothetical protein